ncbi:hypothetical protein D3C73_1590070 [compost metagenome]
MLTRTAPARTGAMIRRKETPEPRKAMISKSLVMRPMPRSEAKRYATGKVRTTTEGSV